jgi:flagellar hook-length control protein FliK
MNAIPLISQAPSGSDAAQLNASASAGSPPLRGANQDFAGALRDAGGKPARKSAGSKPHEATLSGTALPVPGNQPPPVPASPPGLAPSGSPPAVNTDLLAAAQAADAAGAIPGLPAGAAGADPSANPTTPGATADAGSTAVLAPHFDLAAAPVSAPDGVAPTGAGSSVAPTAAASGDVQTAAGIGSVGSGGPAGSGDAGVSAANSPAVPGSGSSNPPAPSIRTLASAATSAGTRIPPALQGSTRDAKSNDGASQGAIAPASSQTSAAANAVNDPTLTGPAAAAAPAQTVMAAAVVQGAPSANFAPSSNDLSPDDLAAADTALQGVAAPKNAPAGAPAAALAQAAAALSAAVTAATAGRIAQEVSSTAEAGAADKRSHANSPDLSLSGASNDGGVGAAQLLTSNTAIDSSPAPTFKVAAGVDTAGFGQGVADKVSVMVDSNLTSAKLQVNPPALGPIEVRIALQGGHAQVWLSSHSAVTRDALESSSPKLREMLGSQGFSQVSVDISQRSFQDRSPPSQAYEAMPSISGDAPGLAQTSPSMSRTAIGLLDAYA